MVNVAFDYEPHTRVCLMFISPGSGLPHFICYFTLVRDIYSHPSNKSKSKVAALLHCALSLSLVYLLLGVLDGTRRGTRSWEHYNCIYLHDSTFITELALNVGRFVSFILSLPCCFIFTCVNYANPAAAVVVVVEWRKVGNIPSFDFIGNYSVFNSPLIISS